MKIAHLVAVSMLLAGFFAGIFGSADTGHATTYQYDVWNYPGPTHTPTTINCGWHDDCNAGAGNANSLDWRNYDDYTVYWRSLSTNESGNSVAGKVIVHDESSGTCHRTYVELESPLGTDLGEIRYLHTTPVTDGTWTWVSSGLYPGTTTFKVGETHHNDCGFYPAHLHQGREPGTAWTKQTQSTWVYPTWSTCHTAGCNTYSSPWQYWQHQRTWWASY